MFELKTSSYFGVAGVLGFSRTNTSVCQSVSPLYASLRKFICPLCGTESQSSRQMPVPRRELMMARVMSCGDSCASQSLKVPDGNIALKADIFSTIRSLPRSLPITYG